MLNVFVFTHLHPTRLLIQSGKEVEFLWAVLAFSLLHGFTSTKPEVGNYTVENLSLIDYQ